MIRIVLSEIKADSSCKETIRHFTLLKTLYFLFTQRTDSLLYFLEHVKDHEPIIALLQKIKRHIDTFNTVLSCQED